MGGSSRDSAHKRRATGGKRAIIRKKRRFEMGRPPANTKMATESRIRVVRTRGGNRKFRALRLENGGFSWGSEAISFPARLLNVVSNVSKSKKKKAAEPESKTAKKKAERAKKKTLQRDETGAPIFSKTAQKNHKSRSNRRQIEPAVEAQFNAGRLLCKISSRPGQVGRADGYILEGEELAFYQRKLQKKRK